MSLPSKMFFLKNGTQVAEIFTNIGWFFEKQLIPELIIYSINEHDALQKDPDFKGKIQQIDFKTLDFDTIVLYGVAVTRENMFRWKQGVITKEQLVDTIVQYMVNPV